MSRRVPPEQVEVYRSGESIKHPSKETWPFAEAQQAYNDKRGVFRDKRRKFILFPDQAPDPSESPSTASSLGPADMEAVAGARMMSCRQRERLIGHFDGSIH